MSAINFPDPSQSPWTNSSTGITYTYSNGVWKALSSEEVFLKESDAESTYLKQADANFVSLSDGGTQQVISGGGGLNVDGDVQKKGNTVPSAVMGASAPSNPGICDFWTDTSGDDPVLKSWNGTEWVEVGSSGASEFAPVISNVTLTENDTTGDRFTSQTFDVDITMLREGEPFSQKALKGEVTAEFAVYPNSEPVSSNAVVSYPNTTRTTYQMTSGVSSGSQSVRVWAPNASGTYMWYFIYKNQDSYVYVYENSTPGNFSDGGATSLYYQRHASGTPGAEYADYFKPSGANPYHYIITSDRTYGLSSHVIMRRGATGGWTVYGNGTGGQTRCAYDPETGHFGSLRAQWGGNPRYWMTLQIGTTPYGNDIRDYTWTYNGDSNGHSVAFGNNKYVVAWKDSYSNKFRTTVFSDTGTYESEVSPPNSGSSSLDFFKFEKDFFWLALGSNFYKSSDGSNWTQISNFPSDWSGIQDIRYNAASGKYQLHTYYGYDIRVFESNNGGATWVLTKDLNNGVSIYLRNLTVGDSQIVYYGRNNSYKVEHAFPYNKQTLTLSGTGADYSDFNVGDSIRPAGQYGDDYIGAIESISGTSIEISSEYIYQVGDVMEAVNPTNSAVSSRYLVIDNTGAVTGTVGSDPGYVGVGPNTNNTLTFPATFNTGNSPDDELPAGTTFKVSAQATNSIGSSEFGPSNIITPA